MQKHGGKRSSNLNSPSVDLFIYLGFYVAFNTVQVISRRVVGRAEETSTYSLSGFCTVNCRPTASNYQLSHLRPYREPNSVFRGGRRECYHSATVALHLLLKYYNKKDNSQLYIKPWTTPSVTIGIHLYIFTFLCTCLQLGGQRQKFETF